MKKLVFALAALAVALVSCTKGGEQEKDTTPAKLLSFEILKADNAFLDKDYFAELISPNMVIRIPGGGMDKSFKATIKVGEFDKLYVNGAAVELTDASAKVDFQGKFAVDIEVVNTKSSKSAAYEVKIGKILQMVSKEVASILASEGMAYNDYYAALNPKTGELYFAYSFTPTGGKKNVGVKKFNGVTFEQVGTEGITPGTTQVNSIYRLAFDSQGTPYVLTKGGDTTNLMSLRKFNGSEWVLVGTPAFGKKQIALGWGPSLYFDDSCNPGIVYATNQRSNEVMSFEGEEWKSSTIAGFPAYDSSLSNYFYGGPTAKLGDKTYGFFTANLCGIYVYELSGLTWSKMLIEDFKAEGETFMNCGNFATANRDGKILLLATHHQASVDQIYSFDGTALTPYGASFEITIGGMANAPQRVMFGVNPTNNQIAVVKMDPEHYPMYSFMDENLQWEDFAYVGTVVTSQKENPEGGEPTTVTEHDIPAATDDTFFALFDTKGTLYVIWPDVDKKSGYHVYSISLEDDILPE